MQVAGDVKKRAKDDTEKTKKALADAKAKADKVGRGGAGGDGGDEGPPLPGARRPLLPPLQVIDDTKKAADAKAKAAAERPARWPSMEVVWTDADATAAGGVTRFEAFCNPNGAASPFDAKVLITAKAGGGVSVATECPLAGLRADVDSCEA